MKKLLLGLIAGLFLGVFTYSFVDKEKLYISPPTQKYPFIRHISSKYFDLSPWEYDGYPVTEYVPVGELPTTTISPINYTNDSRVYEGLPEPFLGHQPEILKYDVDNDGEKEKILITSSAMTHAPHNIEIIKDGEIIFGAYHLAAVTFIESPSNNGFYVRSELDEGGTCCYGGYKKVRFAFEDGEFKPIWEQKTKYLRVVDQE